MQRSLNCRVSSALRCAILLLVTLDASAAMALDDGTRDDRFNPPVEFYGRVVDQDGAPLAKVELLASVVRQRLDKDPCSPEAWPRFELAAATDRDGRFTFSGVQGLSLGFVAVRKPGHLLSPWVTPSYVYANADQSYKPDPKRPVVLRMWKRRGDNPEPEHKSIGLALPCDGTPVTVDLVQGRPAQREQKVGDLKLSLVRDVFGEGRDVRHAWKLTIHATDGGIAVPDAKDEFMFEAPTGGYAPAAVVESGEGGSNIRRSTAFLSVAAAGNSTRP